VKWSQDDKQKFVELCPESVAESLVAYIEQGRPTGGFLYAVLTNDLYETFGRADHINRHCVFEIVSAIFNYAPANCWGSKEKVEAWLKACADERSKK
jgi:hypothetical protein